MNEILQNLRGIAASFYAPLRSIPTNRVANAIERAVTSSKRIRLKHDRLDWDLPDVELARQTRYTISTIATLRRRHARGTLKRLRAAKRIDWERVDFKLSDGEICDLTGCALRTVRQQRKRRFTT